MNPYTVAQMGEAEQRAVSEYGICHSAYIDKDWIERITGCPIAAKKTQINSGFFEEK